jgi:hypothetical protein
VPVFMEWWALAHGASQRDKEPRTRWQEAGCMIRLEEYRPPPNGEYGLDGAWMKNGEVDKAALASVLEQADSDWRVARDRGY